MEAPGKLTRFLFTIMGPAQIGENRAPDGYVADASAELCDKCAEPWTAHERRRKDNISYLRCPTASR